MILIYRHVEFVYHCIIIIVHNYIMLALLNKCDCCTVKKRTVYAILLLILTTIARAQSDKVLKMMHVYSMPVVVCFCLVTAVDR